MKSMFIKTVTGKDQSSIINTMAEVTRSFGGEWTKSNVIRLGSQFTAMMLVSIDEAKEAELKSSLEEQFPELHFFYTKVENDVEIQTTAATVVLDCEDRPGLTHDITKILSDLDLKTESMEFHRLPVAPVGGTVYSAKMTIQFPNDASKDALVESLESIADRARIHFE